MSILSRTNLVEDDDVYMRNVSPKSTVQGTAPAVSEQSTPVATTEGQDGAGYTFTESQLKEMEGGVPTETVVQGTTPVSQQPSVVLAQQPSTPVTQQPTATQIMGGDYAGNKVLQENVGMSGNEVSAAPWEQSFNQFAASSNLPISDAYLEYNKIRKAHGLPEMSGTEYMNSVYNRDVSKTVSDNEKEEKRRKRQETWEKIGNLLIHAGNFAGTLMGAPRMNLESGVELTKRQQEVRDKVLEQRNAHNKDILAQIAKDRADERAKELNDINIAYKQGDLANKTKLADKNVDLIEARRQQAESAKKKNEASTQATLDKNRRENNMAPLKEETERSRATMNKARTAQSNSVIRKNNATAYGKDYEKNRHSIWAKNKRENKALYEQFMKDNDIHEEKAGSFGSSRYRNWDNNLIDQFNAIVSYARASGTQKPRAEYNRDSYRRGGKSKQRQVPPLN